MKIMVTGGAGFIGSNLCEELLKRDFQVVVVDNFDEFYSYKTKMRNVYESFGKLDEYRDILAENLTKEEMIDRCSKRFLSDKYKLYYIDIITFKAPKPIIPKVPIHKIPKNILWVFTRYFSPKKKLRTL